MSLVNNMIASYGRFIRWLLRDSVWRRKELALVALGAGVVGVGSQVAVFYLVIIYARSFAGGEAIILFRYEVDPRSSIGLLAGGSVTAVFLLLLSTLCIYYSRRTILRMAREYEEYCAQRIFRLLGEGGDVFSAMNGGTRGDSYLFRLVKSDSRLAGRVLRMLLLLVIPATTLLVAIAVLFYLEMTLTLIIVVLAAVFLFYQYHVSRRAAQHSMRFEKLASASSGEYRTLIQHYKHQPRADPNEKSVKCLFADGPVKKQLDAYEGRLRAVEESQLVSGIFMAVVVGLIVLVMGAGIIREGTGWGRLLVYVVALRFAMVSLQNVFSTITSINRFYPQVSRYFAFIQSFTRDNGNVQPPGDSYTLEVKDDTPTEILAGSTHQIEIQRGMRLALVTPLELNRYTLGGLVNSLLGNDQRCAYNVLHTVRYARVDHSRPVMSLRRALRLSTDATWDDLRQWFADEDKWREAQQQLPKSMDKSITPRIWQEVAPELKFMLSLISARLDGCSWIFMQAEGLRRLSPDTARFYLSLFTDAVSVVVHNRNFDLVGCFYEQAVAAADEQKLLGLGSPDWFTTVRDTVSESIGNGKRKGAESMQSGTLDDDDLD